MWMEVKDIRVWPLLPPCASPSLLVQTQVISKGLCPLTQVISEGLCPLSYASSPKLSGFCRWLFQMVLIIIHLEPDGKCLVEKKEFIEIPLKDTGKIQSKSPSDGLVRLKLRHGMFSICAKHVGECGCRKDAVGVFCLLPFSKKMKIHIISCVRGRGEHMMHFPNSNQSWLRKCGQIA